jgi:phosphoribosylamine---glycine ligase
MTSRVLLLGSGGRESALALSLARSASVGELIVAPGNPGVAEFAATEPLTTLEPSRILELATRVAPDLVVVGPEAPLVSGAADALRAQGIAVFGPDAEAARIEGSKAFAKIIMREAGIPTARWCAFESVEKAVAYMDELGPPYVVKADGLAAGKGVVVTEHRVEAVEAIRSCLERERFGASGRTVVIEEHMRGRELSVIALSDGTNVVVCEPAQDYKRIFDNDQGPNTGGMGSYSPVPACSPELLERIDNEVMRPTVSALARRGTRYVGALYAGLMLTEEGFAVLEFNARFGDPETQSLMPRLRSDLGELLSSCAAGELAGDARLEWDERACVSVVLAASGYPDAPTTGAVIRGVEAAAALPGVEVFHAGTGMRLEELVVTGGRVLTVSASGSEFARARSLAYRAADLISFDGKQMRSDIGSRAVAAETAA